MWMVDGKIYLEFEKLNELSLFSYHLDCEEYFYGQCFGKVDLWLCQRAELCEMKECEHIGLHEKRIACNEGYCSKVSGKAVNCKKESIIAISYDR